MPNKKANNNKAAAKRAANAAARGLVVSGVTLAPVPTPPALPVTPAPTMPAPQAAYTGPTPPAHFTPEDVALGQDPDGTWIATAIATARIVNAHAEIMAAAKAAGVLLPGTAKRYQSKTDANSNYHNRVRSTIGKPVAIVHGLCASMAGQTRKAIIAACIAAGVNGNTAATQYSMWQLKTKTA